MIQRRKNQVIEAFQMTKDLDAFPKLEEDYKEFSSARGTLSILVFAIISVLALFELNYFLTNHLQYTYEVDFDHKSKLNLNVDITVAMPCNNLGADVMDSTSRDILTDMTINMEDTWFEMSPKQKEHFKFISSHYNTIRNQHHALHSSLWFNEQNYKFIEREELPQRPHDACRIHGTFELNKVAGNFHIIYGKSVSFFGNHAHVVNMFNNAPSNFSHRIDNFSFGENSDQVHNALNYELKLADKENTMFQYFVNVVSTEIGREIGTYQYSVTEKLRIIDHDFGSHGSAGIFFKYDISPIKVKVDLVKKSFLTELIIPLIGIIGGIFATSLMFNATYQSFKDFYCSNSK